MSKIAYIVFDQANDSVVAVFSHMDIANRYIDAMLDKIPMASYSVLAYEIHNTEAELKQMLTRRGLEDE